MYEEAVKVAEAHYRSLENGDYEELLKTLTKELQESAGIRGSSSYFWWKTGRRFV